MAVEVIVWVLENSPAVGTEKVVLLGLANHAHKDGRNAWPALSTLARYANVGVRAVQKALRKLEDAGHIKVELNAGGNDSTPSDQRPNRYALVMTSPGELRDTGGVKLRTSPPVNYGTEPPVLQDAPPLSHSSSKPSFNRTSTVKKNIASQDSPVLNFESRDVTRKSGSKTREPTAWQEMFGAVALACYESTTLAGKPLKLTASTAKNLTAMGFTPEEVPEIRTWITCNERWRTTVSPSDLETAAPRWKAGLISKPEALPRQTTNEFKADQSDTLDDYEVQFDELRVMK